MKPVLDTFANMFVNADSGIRTIRELVDRMAETRPTATFLVSPETGQEVTFKGLREQAVLLAEQLGEMGLEKGDKAAFLLDNGLFTAQLFLGVMYGGFVSVPLNVRAGRTQLSYTLDHCDAKVVFVSEEYRTLMHEVLADVQRPIRVIAAEMEGVAGRGEAQIPATRLPVPEPEDAALIIYSSGSTGQPKGALHCHSSVLAHASNSVRSHQLTPADRSLLVLPLYHINAECVTLMPTLLSGGSVVVPQRFSVSRFWDWLDEYRCTWSAVVPTIISQLLDWEDPRADSRQAAFQRIRFLRSSSAPLSPSLHREFMDKFKLLLIQAMGSTEAGNIFSNPQPPCENKIGSPGLPWGFEAKVVDRDGVALPAGEPGEVFIRGPAMMQGYYKQPEATAAVLDPDGWLHTGDLAYRDEDGYFFVVGRSKELIIKGGVNIAPRQIDEVLESHPAVLEAAAVGVPDRYLGEDVLAFVVLRAGASADERQLLTFCESRLGHFKTPSRIHVVGDLPKGPSGKVQRLKLLDAAVRPAAATFAASGNGSPATSGNGQLAPGDLSGAASPIEQLIARIWGELLQEPQVDVQSNFFALGGDSLSAIQCLSRLRDKLPVVLSLSDFFENATVAQQAALVRRRLSADFAGAGGPLPDGRADGQASSDQSAAELEQSLLQKLSRTAGPQAIPLRDRTRPCPLSPAQQRLWFLEQLNSGVPVYNEVEAVRLQGELHVDALEQALNTVVARHEVFRTTIRVVDEQPVAVVHESWPLRLKQIDLSALPADARQAEVERLLIDEPRGPYRLDAEPGIRATLLRLAPGEHVFILMMHHIVCDWSSEGVLWRELSAQYRALCRGEPAALPPLPIQHGDYAAWQQQQVADTDLSADLSFWEENLRGAPALLELPTDRPRPRVCSYRGAKQRFQLDATLADALRDFSRREQTSPFTVFAAVLDTLLYRYTGQEDILVGIPMADRDRPEVQSMIGFLLHTHVLRTGLSGDTTFRDLVARVQKGVLALYSHRAVPFDQVVSKVQPERNPGYSPLFQVMLNWRDRDQMLSFIGMEGLAVESLLAESGTSKFDMILTLTDLGDGISLEIEYSTDLFDKTRIERMAEHMRVLLEGIVAEPDQQIGKLPLLSEAERRQLLVEWNDTRTDYPTGLTLMDLFEAQAARTPEAVAVAFEGESLTYRELDQRANQLGHYLQKLGVGPDVPVGICTERSLEMVVGLYGVHKAGGAYVPIDPEYPRQRLARMFEVSRTPVLLMQERLCEIVPEYQGRIVYLDAQWDQIAREPEHAPPRRTRAEHLAYIIFTSGSTGEPKGVMVPHVGICNRLLWMQQAYHLDATDRVLQKTPFSFDVSVWEFFWPLQVGAALVVARPGGHRDPEYLTALIEKEKITTIHFVPSMLRTFLEDLGRGRCRSLRRVVCSGEALPYDLVERFFERIDAELHNLYGPTEASVDVTAWTCTPDYPRQAVPIGKPIANTRVYVLNEYQQLVPEGVPGELYLGGIQLARGYLNRPDLTAEKFVPDPFVGQAEARLYKTGDSVRWLPDGNLEYLGRLDHQVKIRGFRIELGEIESCLRRHPTIEDVVVLAREDSPGDKRLVAYFVAKEEEAPAVDDLRSRLKQELPEFMVPAAFMVLKALPLTPSGKVDRRALPKPDGFPREAEHAYVPPRTPIEEALAGTWREVLNLERVGIHDIFFEMGGHSLLATQVVSRIRSALQVELPLRVFFEGPTVAQLAQHVEAVRWTREARAGNARRPVGNREEGAI